MPKIFPLPCQTGTTDSPFPQKFSELIRIPPDNIFGITQEHQLFSRIINHLFMKKEIEFEPALRQVISQTFIDTPAPRKTRYRIIRPDLNTLKNAEDNLSIVLCVSERKTDFRPKHIPCSQSAHYMKHFPRRSLPRCGHHALVCIPMLSTKIRNLQAKYKLKIRFCAATAPAARAFPNDSIRRVARMKAPRPAGSYRPSVCGRCSRSARR